MKLMKRIALTLLVMMSVAVFGQKPNQILRRTTRPEKSVFINY